MRFGLLFRFHERSLQLAGFIAAGLPSLVPPTLNCRQIIHAASALSRFGAGVVDLREDFSARGIPLVGFWIGVALGKISLDCQFFGFKPPSSDGKRL